MASKIVNKLLEYDLKLNKKGDIVIRGGISLKALEIMKKHKIEIVEALKEKENGSK